MRLCTVFTADYAIAKNYVLHFQGHAVNAIPSLFPLPADDRPVAEKIPLSLSCPRQIYTSTNPEEPPFAKHQLRYLHLRAF